jgi:hypothetical protein
VSDPPVTVVCATRNARLAVRLTFASFFHHHPGSWRVFVADNGSTDGTLADLRAYKGIEVVSLDQRLELERRRRERDRRAAMRLANDGSTAGRLLTAAAAAPDPDPGEYSEHGATLDWLVERVDTPYVLTLDSDVEFRGECVTTMLNLADERGLSALGVFEPGHLGYRPRLASQILLLRTDVLRRLRTSFRGITVCEDPDEQRRWDSYARRWEITPDELRLFPATRIYPTGAHLFERLIAAGHAWADLPPDIAKRFRHWGHLSWGGLSDAAGSSAAAREEHERKLAAIRRALAAYETADVASR